MKFKNILFTLLVALVAVLGVTVNAESTAPGSYTVRFRDLHRLSGGDYFPGMNYHFYYKVNSDGKVIYCMQRKNDVVDGTETYYLSEELDAKYAYVMENGYPNKSLTGNNDEDYYITGLAIWYLINPSDSITMDDLKTGLTAEESVDGLSHQNILPEDADLNDPWGGEYLIETSTDGSGSITTSNAVSVGGLESEVTLSW
mgnify:CR=1 FL=1